jgi:hypothetical protein
MTKDLTKLSRRSLLMAGGALTFVGLLPLRANAAGPIKMAGIYTVPVEQQWVSRIHQAAEAAKAAGTVEYVYTENVVVSRKLWKFSGVALRAFEGLFFQAARSRGIGSIG